MLQNDLMIALLVILLPLAGSLIAGLLGKKIGRRATHTVTISLVGVAFLLSAYLFYLMVCLGKPAEEEVIYTWVQSGG